MLIVVLDTVRADHLRAYGYERDTSYQLEAIAQAGALFEDTTVSSTWTLPGHASLFTGEPPWVHGVHHTPEDLEFPVGALRPELPTLAERFDAAGYRSVALVTNALAITQGLDRGFQVTRSFENDGGTVKAAKALLAEPDDRPLFLVVNLLSPHAPWMVTPEVPWSEAHRSRLAETPGVLAPMVHWHSASPGLDPGLPCAEDLRCDIALAAGELELGSADLALVSDLYDSGLVRLDGALRALVSGWTASRSGVVAVTSDHGEYLGEHHLLQHRFVTLPEVLHVPMVLVGPGVPAGVRVSEPVQVADLYGAVLQLAGMEHEGWNLLDALEGRSRPEPIQAAAWPLQREAKKAEIISQPWRWHREGDEAVAVTGDRVVPVHLAGQSLSEALVADLAERARAIPLDEEARAGAMDPSTQAALEALGYMN